MFWACLVVRIRVFFHAWFSISCFKVRVLNNSHAHMSWACVCKLSPLMQASSYVHRYLPRNPNLDFLCCLVCLFHMFFLYLNPFHMFVHIWFSILYACLSLVFSTLRLGFYVYVFFKYHDHSFTCPCINAIGAKLL